MTKRNAKTNYDTNLASEFLIMALLHRAGKEAFLSLGNKKGADIIVRSKNDRICILEVKGVNKNDDWLIGNSSLLPSAPNLFYALVGFEGKISDINHPPKFYMIPSETLVKMEGFKIAKNEKTVFLSHKHIRENYSEYLNTFKSLDEYLELN